MLGEAWTNSESDGVQLDGYDTCKTNEYES